MVSPGWRWSQTPARTSRGGLNGDEGFLLGRREATLAFVRAAGAIFTSVVLLSSPLQGTGAKATLRSAPIIANIGIILSSALIIAVVRHTVDVKLLRRLALGVTVGELVFFAVYAASFHELRGAGSVIGALLLIEGPVRFGPIGGPVTAAPVAAIALAWSQVDVAGYQKSPPVVLVLCALLSGGAVVGTTLVRRTTSAIRRAQEQFQAAFRHASIGMAVIGTDGLILQANSSLGQMISSDECALIGTNVLDMVHPDDRASVCDALVSARSSSGCRLHTRLCRPDGEVRWGLLAGTVLAHMPGVRDQLVLQLEDVTDRRLFEEKLAHQAGHDVLTGLPNRSQLVESLDRALVTRRNGLAVLFIDLDRFKLVNDSRGHSAGDALLVEVARRLSELIRPGDSVARLGGDEFVVLCHDVTAVAEAMAVADRITDAMRVPVTIGHEEFYIGASIGIALPSADDTPETLLRDADTAMYLAKDAGGGRHQVFVPSIRAATLRRHDLEAAMRTALERGELELHYQPTLRLQTQSIFAMEALLRWLHPVRGYLPPGDFVPIAEESDLIVDIGTWVLGEAMRQCATWEAALPEGLAPQMCVNVSRRQFAHVGFVDLVRRLLAETGATASFICLEVTETALSGSVEPIIDSLQELRRMGVRLAIDDFGTGHASLTYLARLPVDVLKIDQSFVAELAEDAGCRAIVGSVTAMSHAFGLEVIAEGVETDAQLHVLAELGCDAAQGYLFSRPVPADRATALLMHGAVLTQVPAPRGASQAVLAVGSLPRDSAEVARPRRRAIADQALRYRLLLDLARDVTGGLDLSLVLSRTFEALRQITHFTGGSIQLIDDAGSVGIVAAVPPPTAEALLMRIPVGQGVSGGIALTGEPRYIPDIETDPQVTPVRRTRCTSSGVRSYFGVPLISEGRVIGVLQIDSVDVDAWGEEDRLMVLAFVPIVAAAVQNARYFEREVISVQRMHEVVEN